MEDRTIVMAGDKLVAGFVDADAAAAGTSRQILAESALIKIKAAIASYRNDRTPHVLLINTAYALGATVLLAIVLLVVRRTFRKLDALAEQRLKSRIEAFEAQSHKIVQARQLSNALFGILKGLYISTLLVLGYLYLHFVLFLYPWTRPLGARLLTILLEPLQAMGLGLIDSLPGIAFVAVVVIVTRYVLRLMRLYFESVDRGTVTLARFDREWALPTYKIARLLIHRLCSGGGLSLYPRFELGSVQGRVDLSWRGRFVGLLVGHRQPDGGLYHDLPARLQGRRPHQYRKSHRWCAESARGCRPRCCS
jgi:hypothetical protein